MERSNDFIAQLLFGWRSGSIQLATAKSYYLPWVSSHFLIEVEAPSSCKISFETRKFVASAVLRFPFRVPLNTLYLRRCLETQLSTTAFDETSVKLTVPIPKSALIRPTSAFTNLSKP